MTEIYILTREDNDYNQHGSYFICAFDHKPSIEELLTINGYNIDKNTARYLIDGVKPDVYWVSCHSLKKVRSGQFAGE